MLHAALNRRSFCTGLGAVPLAMRAGAQQPTGIGPLASWTDGEIRRTILQFVSKTVDPRSPDFVLPADRIAVFDNDGTLWVEKPMPNEVYFTFAKVTDLAAKDPSLAQQQPYKAALEHDAAYFHEAGPKAILELFVRTHTNVSQDEFATQVQRFMATARHPKLKRPFTTCIYTPMLELLTYLRAAGYQTWICSGGDTDFMRAFAPQVYGVPAEQVIGSEMKRESRRENGRLIIWRLPQIDAVNDKDLKPVDIDRQIGKRPVVVGGNVLSGGDIAMMEYSKGRSGPSLQLLINHDDTEREFAYAEKDNFSLDAARKHGFKVVSMKSDWKTVFAA